MKLKYPIKKPVTVTNICLMLLPLLFILFEMLKQSSEDIKFGVDFSFALWVIMIIFIPLVIFGIFNIDIVDIISKPIEFIFDHKYTSIIIFSLLFVLGVISFVLYSKNKIKAYKKLALPISAVWLSVILIHFFILSVFVFAYIVSETEMEILAFLATVVCFAIFLPLYIIAVITVDKTASIKISEQPKEEENEKTS